MPNLTKRIIDASKPSEKRFYVWDDDLKGFGLQVLPSGVKSFVVQYRTDEGRSRRITLGKFGALTPDQARKLAQRTLASVADGIDPVANRQAIKAAPTVNDLLDRYLKEHVEVHNAASTQINVKVQVKSYIRPALGRLKVSSVTRQDVAKLHRSMAHVPRQANIALSTISKAFNLAEMWGMRDDMSNPTRHIKRYKENERDRFLSAEELGRLGKVLDEAEEKGLCWIIKETTSKHLPKEMANRRTVISPMALICVRLLLLTGARLSEILELEWEHVDFVAGTIALPSRKGDGRKPHPVSTGVLSILSNVDKVEGSPFVLPSPKDNQKHLSKSVMENAWQRIRHHADIKDVRLHDLRHTVGTYASQGGGNSFLISHLLRQKNVSVTNRYVNPDAYPIRAISNRIGDRIEAGLRGEGEGAEIIPFKGQTKV